MPILIPTAELAKILGAHSFLSSATTVRNLLQELEAKLEPHDFKLKNRHVTFLVNGRSLHALQGLDTPLGEQDQVWMIVPSAGG